MEGGGTSLYGKGLKGRKWWEVKDWGESMNELMSGKKKQLQ